VPIVTSGKIDALHTRLSAAFALHIDGNCEVAPRPEHQGEWHRRALNRDIEFFLFTRKAMQQWGARAGSRVPCPVVPAIARSEDWNGGELAWASWREIWIQKGNDQFEFAEAALTFFWGRRSASQNISEQLFRAEWPQKSRGGKRSAQPHWQVDWPLASLDRTVSGIHLGMSGWEGVEVHDAENGSHVSDHFTRYATDVIADLEKWAPRTLEYSLDQIARYFPSDWA